MQCNSIQCFIQYNKIIANDDSSESSFLLMWFFTRKMIIYRQEDGIFEPTGFLSASLHLV